ncbi:glycine receptor subunit alpha-2-like [Dermacentor silvarum]|uniref:glycine receptor subunit alpha-2-like n=1 Tax=Dermacentor silvarum TaxID=543639 RepID=UPI00189C04F5|nr:glycine receptor subunit alpha-2-like [Dermacentor silvarum]
MHGHSETLVSGQPTNVSVNLIVYELGALNEKDMDFRVDMDLQESWTDDRLALTELGVNSSFITNEGSLIASIWKPDIFFVNAKDATTHDVTVPNQLLQILPDGAILFSIRLALAFSDLAPTPHRLIIVKTQINQRYLVD